MKIALVTIHNVNNYGGVLQAYATKKLLSNYGDVSIINYDNKHLSKQLNLIRFDFSIYGIIRSFYDILRVFSRYKAIKKFKIFIATHMNLTQKFTNEELLAGKAKDFNIYICGSDQIWNPEVVSAKREIDPIYFLAFANEKAKKISFSSSMGSYKFLGNEKKQLKGLLKDFSKISVREDDAKEMLEQLLVRDVCHLLDPTLFMSKYEWLSALNIDKSKRSQKDNYILLYSLPKTYLVKKSVEYFSKKLRLKTVLIDQGLKPIVNTDIHIKDAGPVEFIELFSNASFVITGSFHGTCFAVNFEKEFISIPPKDRANRTISLLTLVNLKDRLINNEDQLNRLNLNIDYELHKKKLIDEKNKALEFGLV